MHELLIIYFVFAGGGLAVSCTVLGMMTIDKSSQNSKEKTYKGMLISILWPIFSIVFFIYAFSKAFSFYYKWSKKEIKKVFPKKEKPAESVNQEEEPEPLCVNCKGKGPFR